MRNILITGILLAVSTLTAAQTGESWKASGQTEERLTKSRPEFNYYEEKVPSYSLPDLLTDASGDKITTAREWNKHRRPELLNVFRDNVYGRVPVTPYTQE